MGEEETGDFCVNCVHVSSTVNNWRSKCVWEKRQGLVSADRWMVIRTKTYIKTTIDAVYFVSFCILHQPYITYSGNKYCILPNTIVKKTFSNRKLSWKRAHETTIRKYFCGPSSHVIRIFCLPPPHPTKSLEVLQPPPPRLVITPSSIPKPFRFFVDFLSLPTFFVAPTKKYFPLFFGDTSPWLM